MHYNFCVELIFCRKWCEVADVYVIKLALLFTRSFDLTDDIHRLGLTFDSFPYALIITLPLETTNYKCAGG